MCLYLEGNIKSCSAIDGIAPTHDGAAPDDGNLSRASPRVRLGRAVVRRATMLILIRFSFY
jgi:hypothetical protein